MLFGADDEANCPLIVFFVVSFIVSFVVFFHSFFGSVAAMGGLRLVVEIFGRSASVHPVLRILSGGRFRLLWQI